MHFRRVNAWCKFEQSTFIPASQWLSSNLQFGHVALNCSPNPIPPRYASASNSAQTDIAQVLVFAFRTAGIRPEFIRLEPAPTAHPSSEAVV